MTLKILTQSLNVIFSSYMTYMFFFDIHVLKLKKQSFWNAKRKEAKYSLPAMSSFEQDSNIRQKS